MKPFNWAGQYELSCNALDAVASGAGIKSKNFDFGYFHREISNIQTPDQEIQTWVEEWPKIMRELVQKTNQPTQIQLFKNINQRFSQKFFGKIIWKI